MGMTPMGGINPPAAGMSSIPVEAPGGSGAGARMVFKVVQSLKAIASSYPDVAEDVDELISSVEKLGMTIMSSGSPGQADLGGAPNLGSPDLGGPF